MGKPTQKVGRAEQHQLYSDERLVQLLVRMALRVLVVHWHCTVMSKTSVKKLDAECMLQQNACTSNLECCP
jgi:hypothetical protein